MKTYLIEHSQNGWEYTGHYVVHCEDNCKKENNSTLLIDGKITIEFSEEFDLKEGSPNKAVCVDNVNNITGRPFIGLTKGKIYDIFDETDIFVTIVDDFNSSCRIHKSRFKIISEDNLKEKVLTKEKFDEIKEKVFGNYGIQYDERIDEANVYRAIENYFSENDN